MRDHEVMRPLKVFIVGGPRSGTSALARAMRLVFELPGHGESHTIPAIATVTHPLRQYWERFRANPADLLVKTLPTAQIEELIFRVLRDFYVQTYGGASWVDKTPSDEAVHSISLIPRIFPDARIVVIRRNGIEVVRSVRAKFGLSFADACTNWSSVMAGIALARERCPRALEVDHHDFIHDTDALARACAGHLGRPALASRLADFLRQDRVDQLTEDSRPSPTTLDDVDWPPEDKRLFESVCGPWMTAFGYPMSGTGTLAEADAAPAPRKARGARRPAKGRQA